MKKETITDEWLISEKIDIKTFREWEYVMQSLWTAAIIFYKTINDKNLFPRAVDNEILIGNYYKIKSNMVNNSFVESELYFKDVQLCEIRFTGNCNPVCQSIFLILKYHAV